MPRTSTLTRLELRSIKGESTGGGSIEDKAMDVLGQRWRSRFSAAEYDPVAPRRCCQSGGGALLAQSSRKLKFQMRFLLIQVSALSLSLIAAKSLLAEGKGAPDRIVAKAVAAAGAEDPLSTPKGFFLRTEG